MDCFGARVRAVAKPNGRISGGSPKIKHSQKRVLCFFTGDLNGAIVENIAEQKQTPSAQKGVIEYCMQPQKTQADERTIYVSGGRFEEIDGITWAYCPNCDKFLGKYDLKTSMGQMSFLLTYDKHKKECTAGN